MKNRNVEYWEKRALELEARKNREVIATQRDLAKINRRVSNILKKGILYWASKFATNNELTYSETMKQLSPSEIQAYRMDLEDYIHESRMLDDETPEEVIRQVENASAAYHITRFEVMKRQVINAVLYLIAQENDLIFNFLKELYKDTYYVSTYYMAKGLSMKINFMKPNEYAIKELIKKPWTNDGIEFSKRLWGPHRERLVNELSKTLEESLVSGRNPLALAEDMAKKLEVNKHHAKAILHTESARIAEEARMKNYIDLDVEMYIIVSTLDHKTSEICRNMDGKIFAVKDRQVGKNYPPFHTHCRTTTAPYIKEEYGIGERAARDKSGKTIYVPEDMTYHEFHKKYIESDNKYSAVEKAWKNRHSDKKQHERYKSAGVDVPKNFDKYQKMKYNDDKGYWRVKNQYRSFNAIDKKEWPEQFKIKCKDTIKNFAKNHDLDLNEHSAARYHDRISDMNKTTYMSEEDFVTFAKNKPNYREPEGNLIVFRNEIAVIKSFDNPNHIISIVPRKNAKKGWIEYD